MKRKTKKPEFVNPLDSTDGQLMIMAAHRYCLGRQSYIVGSCIDWLRLWWGSCEPKTRVVIVRDTVIALQDGDAGSSFDTEAWKQFAQWAYDQMTPERKSWCKQAVAHRENPFPLSDTP